MTAIQLGPVEQIPIGEGRQFLLGTQAIAVFRARDGGLYATQASCPHGRGNLADGIVGAGRVVCPLHQYSFDLASGRAKAEACPNLRTHRVVTDERGDMCVILAGEDSEAA